MQRRIIWGNICERWGLSLLTIVTLFLCLSFSLMGVWLYDNVQDFFVVKKIGNTIEEDKFVISQTNKYQRFLGTGDTGQLMHVYRKLKQDNRVNQLYLLYNFDIPTTLNIDLFGVHFVTDMFLFAASDNLFTNNIGTGKSFGTHVPVGFSMKLLDLYNMEIANAGGVFPKLKENIVHMLPFNVIFGQSSLFTIQGKSVTMPGRVTDISNDFPVMGISIPLSLARKVQQKLGVGTLTLYKIIGHVKNPKDLTVLHDQYGHNVTFTTDADMLYTINQQLRVVRYALAGVNIIMRVVMISFLLFLTMSVMRNNQKVLHIFSLHGASRWQMFSIVWGEMMVYLGSAIVLVSGSILMVNLVLLPLMNVILHNKIVLQYTILPLDWGIWVLIIGVYVCLITGIVLWSGRKKMK